MKFVVEVFTMKKRKYPYKGISDPRYKKDKKELFAKHGNGWWRFGGYVRLEMLSEFDRYYYDMKNFDERSNED